MRPQKKKTSRPHRPAAVPRTYAAAATSAGREEQPPATIAAHAAEPTLDDDWVKRTSAAALILPPPPQFADGDTTYQDTAVPADPSPCPAIPHLVVERFPSWIRHFKTIAGALGHAPNAQAYGRGVIFSPKSASELEIVERTMREAAEEDSTISWCHDRRDIRCILRRQRRPNKAAAKTQVLRVDHARPSAEAAPREAPVDAPAATAIPDATTPDATVQPDALTPDATNILDAHTPVATVQPDAPTPAVRTIFPAAYTPDASSTTLDALTPTDSKTAHHRERRRRRKRAPRPPRAETAWKKPAQTNCLDDMVQAITKILTSGMAAYLHEKGAMPEQKQQPRVHSQVIWRTRAGERPAQKHSTGETRVPCARPG